MDRLDLLVEVVLALRLLHLPLDAATDALLDLQDVDLGLEQTEQVFEPLAHVKNVEHVLLLLELERQVGGNHVGQTPGFIDARDRGQHLGRNLLVELHVLVKLRQHGAAHRLNLMGLGVEVADQLGATAEMRLFVPHVQNLRALATLHQHLHRAIGQLQHLQDAGDRADSVEVVGGGLVLGGGLLRHQQDALTGVHRQLERFNRLGSPNKQRDDHVRKDHDVAQRQQRQIHGVASGGGRIGHRGSLLAVWRGF